MRKGNFMRQWVKTAIQYKLRWLVVLVCIILLPSYIIMPIFEHFNEMLSEWEHDLNSIINYGKDE
jgi:type IV secretory pathway VirB6-like protein